MMKELMRVIKESEHSFIEWSKMETLGIPSVGKYYVDTDDLEEATELLPKKYVEKSKLKKRAGVIANLPILLIYEDKVELCQRKKK